VLLSSMWSSNTLTCPFSRGLIVKAIAIYKANEMILSTFEFMYGGNNPYTL
jgi:hypothetical protein